MATLGAVSNNLMAQPEQLKLTVRTKRATQQKPAGKGKRQYRDQQTVEWQMRGDSKWDALFANGGLTRQPPDADQWRGEPFSVSAIPIPDAQWKKSPLAEFLRYLCGQLKNQDVALLVYDLPAEDEERSGPVIRWCEARVGADRVALGAELPLVVHARGSNREASEDRSSAGCLILLHPTNKLSVRDVQTACRPFESDVYATLMDPEDAALLQLSDDDPLCNCGVCRDEILPFVSEHLAILSCNEWDAVLSEMKLNSHRIFGSITPVTERGLAVTEGVCLGEEDHRKLGSYDTEIWISLTIKGGSAGNRAWLDWPYSDSFGPDVFIGAAEEMTVSECYMLLGSVLRLIWIGKNSLASAAIKLHRHLRSHERQSLLASIQFAARRPARLLGWFEGHESDPPKLKDLVNLLMVSIRSGPDAAEANDCVQDTLMDFGMERRATEPREWSAYDWMNILRAVASRASIQTFLESLVQKDETQFAPALARYEQQRYHRN